MSRHLARVFAGFLARALAPFDPRGRLSAPAFRLAVIRLLLAFFGLLCLSIWLGGLDLRGPAILAFTGLLPVGLAAVAHTARRLHDRDRTGWWVGLYALTEGLNALPLDEVVDAHPLPVMALVAALLGFFAWFVLETLLRPGTAGPNRYGPAPFGPGA